MLGDIRRDIHQVAAPIWGDYLQAHREELHERERHLLRQIDADKREYDEQRRGPPPPPPRPIHRTEAVAPEEPAPSASPTLAIIVVALGCAAGLILRTQLTIAPIFFSRLTKL